ncbi:EAL domain-containing protein [Moraxella sp. ZY21109]|uniref:EAL domain-containing protein n=1 Tax=Moraxella sp. ZY21109 TaxID=2911969 RepID=UPI003D7DEC18
MRNALFTQKLKLSEIRLLIVDDNQVRYNKIVEILQEQSLQVNALLLDDIRSFEKQLATSWDLIIFGRAYDLKLEQAFPIIQNSIQPDIPVLMLRDEDYHPDQYSQYLNKGVFDILNLDFTASTYMMLVRALSYSRSIQATKRLNEELETMQQHAQHLAHESSKAIALLEEGIHAQANEEYVKLFGFKSEDDLIGLPVMDVLQPKNIQQFKQNFKKISQGQFEQTGLEISTSNPNATHSYLKLEYFPAEDGAVQLIVDTIEGKGSALGGEKIHPLSSAMLSMMRHIKNNPANFNTLVVMGLKQCPEAILEAHWEEKLNYFREVTKYLQDYNDATVYRIDPLTYITLVQTESQAVLDARLSSLKSLQKPQLLTIADKTLPLNLRLGYQILTEQQYDDESFLAVVGQAYDTLLPEAKAQANDDFLSLIEETPAPVATPVPSVALEMDIEPVVAQVNTPVSTIGDLDLDLDLGLETDIATSAPVIEPVTANPLNDSLDLDLSLDIAPLDTPVVPSAPVGSDLGLSLELEPMTTSVAEPSLSLEIEQPEIQLDGLSLQLDEPETTAPTISGLSLEIEQPSIELALDKVEPVVEPVAVQAVEIESIAPTPIVEPIAPATVGTPVPMIKPTTSSSADWSPMLKSLQQNLQHGLVSLRFQQYYDKDDSMMFTYEVSSSFIYDNAWKDLVDMPDLNEAPELSIELDRWMVIEASKQLHNFVTQYPNSRIVVNLNQHILTNPQFPELVGKLAKMIGGQQQRPLVLQFSEKALSENVGISQHYIAELKKQGVDIAVRGFGTLLLSKTILERIPMDIIGLHTDFNKQVHDTNGAAELQEKMNEFKEICPNANFVLHDLDDMNSFANAWNVEARFIKSAYFQKKMDNLVMQTQ